MLQVPAEKPEPFTLQVVRLWEPQSRTLPRWACAYRGCVYNLRQLYSWLSEAILRSLRNVLVSIRILFLGKKNFKSLTSTPENVSLLVTKTPVFCLWKKNSWYARNPFFLTDHITLLWGITCSTLITTLIGNEKGRNWHLRLLPLSMHWSLQETSLMTEFQLLQHVRSVKTFHTFSIAALTRICSSITITRKTHPLSIGEGGVNSLCRFSKVSFPWGQWENARMPSLVMIWL